MRPKLAIVPQDEPGGAGRPGDATLTLVPQVPHPDPAPPEPAQPRIAALDLGRFLAAFGIVWAHGGGIGAEIGYPSLGLFLVLTGYLAVGSYLRDPGPHFWAARAKRILVPWLFWCLVFRLLHDYVARRDGFHLLTEPFSLLIGPEIHLWFLPAAMLALVFVPALAGDIRNRAGLIRAMVALAVLSAFLGMVHLSTGPMQGISLPAPFPQWAFALPIYLWGVLQALALRQGAGRVTVIGALVASALTYAVAPGIASVQMAVSALIFLGLHRLRLKGRRARIAGWLGAQAFGIYLMHPVFTLLAYKLFGADLSREALALFAFAGAFAATVALRHLPVVRALA